jgi:hypothetical protein
LFLFALLVAAPARAQVGLGAYCEGDSVHIHVAVYMNSFIEDATGHGIIVVAYLMGTCGTELVVTPEPLPMPAFMTSGDFEFVVANPDPERYYMYQARGVDPEGNTYTLPWGGDVSTVGFCGGPDAIAARGYLHAVSPGYHELEPCPDSCWYATPSACAVDLGMAAPGWESLVDSGQLVNLYGLAVADMMPGAPCVIVSRVEPETGALGCATVAVVRSTWGALKATYR